MRRSALVVAHPGHELRVFGWYERALPHLFVLTAGSRSGDEGRLSFSRELARRMDVPLGALFGRFLDRQIYDALLARDPAPFRDWTIGLTEALSALDPDLVVTDGWQMYNVAHDLVHVMARVAAQRAGMRLGRVIDVVEYDVAPQALAAVMPKGAESFRIELDDDALARKQMAAAGCADVRAEMAEIFALEGRSAQRVEVFRHAVELDALVPAAHVVPPYERFGAERVAAGTYRQCIRWREHVEPIVAALRRM